MEKKKKVQCLLNRKLHKKNNFSIRIRLSLERSRKSLTTDSALQIEQLS